MARETVCQTPDCVYGISISTRRIRVQVDLPAGLSFKDRQLLEDNLHNAVELVLAPYFAGRAEPPRRSP